MTTAATRFLRFNGVGALGIVVQLVTVEALIRSPSHIGAAAATATGVIAAVVHNFLWHVRWTWADRQASRGHLARMFVLFAMTNGLVSLIGATAIVAALVAATRLHVVLANILAIAACGLLNFWLSDRVVFEAGACPPGPARERRGKIRLGAKG